MTEIIPKHFVVVSLVQLDILPRGIFPRWLPKWQFSKQLEQTWEVVSWVNAQLGCCHLGKYPWEVAVWEKAFGKVTKTYVLDSHFLLLKQCRSKMKDFVDSNQGYLKLNGKCSIKALLCEWRRGASGCGGGAIRTYLSSLVLNLYIFYWTLLPRT